MMAAISKTTALSLCLTEARRLCFSPDVAELRLAAILADNALELILFNLVEEFIFHDRWSGSPTWNYDRRIQIHATFEAKITAALEQGWLDLSQAEVARVGHYIRNGAYHTGELASDNVAAAWTPMVINMAIQVGAQHSLIDPTSVAPVPQNDLSAALELCISTILDRIDQVLDGLHEYGTASTGPRPSDDDLDEILATAEAAWGVGFLEITPGKKKEEMKEMLRTHVFDGSALPKRHLTLPRLRTWQGEAVALRSSTTLEQVGAWWRVVDRRLSVYERTVELANL